MAASDLIFSGLWHLAGETVGATICGLDCGDFLVTTTGTITVPLQSDADQLLTAAYIISKDGITPDAEQNTRISIASGGVHVTVVVPVTIGFTYISQGQCLRPASAQDIGSREGAALGKTRRQHSASFLLSNAIGLAVGTSFSKLDFPEMVNPDIPVALPQDQMFNGVLWMPAIEDSYTFDSKLAWQVSRPWPCTVEATSSFLAAEER